MELDDWDVSYGHGFILIGGWHVVNTACSVVYNNYRTACVEAVSQFNSYADAPTLAAWFVRVLPLHQRPAICRRLWCYRNVVGALSFIFFFVNNTVQVVGWRRFTATAARACACARSRAPSACNPFSTKIMSNKKFFTPFVFFKAAGNYLIFNKVNQLSGQNAHEAIYLSLKTQLAKWFWIVGKSYDWFLFWKNKSSFNQKWKKLCLSVCWNNQEKGK